MRPLVSSASLGRPGGDCFLFTALVQMCFVHNREQQRLPVSIGETSSNSLEKFSHLGDEDIKEPSSKTNENKETRRKTKGEI